MAEYIYTNVYGDIVICGDYDFARRALLEERGFELVETVGEPLPDVGGDPEPEPEPDDEDE